MRIHPNKIYDYPQKDLGLIVWWNIRLRSIGHFVSPQMGTVSLTLANFVA